MINTIIIAAELITNCPKALASMHRLNQFGYVVGGISKWQAIRGTITASQLERLAENEELFVQLMLDLMCDLLRVADSVTRGQLVDSDELLQRASTFARNTAAGWGLLAEHMRRTGEDYRTAVHNLTGELVEQSLREFMYPKVNCVAGAEA